MAKHVTAADLRNLHQPPEGAGGKGCLTRHQGRAEGNKCSHQWQAVVKARSHWRVYEVPGKPELSVLKAGNFGHFKRPYWHNAHHIIPNGALKAAIAEAGKDAKGIVNLIKQGLLKAEYNLNDKINMVILPMESKYGVLLRLPRHLKGDEVGPGEKGEFFSHEAYSDEAESSLEPIMDDFRQKADDAQSSAAPHDKPDVTLSKKRLENLSQRIYDAIRSAGKDKPGESLSALAAKIFA